MKKFKLSLGEKKCIRGFVVVLLIQLLLILTFVRMWDNSQQLNISDTKQVNITVEDMYIVHLTKRGSRLIVIAESTRYRFPPPSTSREHSVHELYDSISKGDQLSLCYYEASGLFQKVNCVVDARSDAEIYRSLDEFNRGKQGLHTFLVIFYAVVQLIFTGIVLLFIWNRYNVLKGLCRKLKKRRHSA